MQIQDITVQKEVLQILHIKYFLTVGWRTFPFPRLCKSETESESKGKVRNRTALCGSLERTLLVLCNCVA